jgi:hypothetical protein
VHDVGFGGAPTFAALGGPPSISVGIGPMTLASPHTAPFGLGLQPGSGALSRLRNRALQALLDKVILREVHDRLAEVQRSLGLEPTGGLSGLSPHLHLQNGLAEFEHPRPDLPPQVHFVGALVDPLPSKEVPSWWADVEDSSRPIMHVPQGTVADTELGDLVLPTLHALADLDVLVVASVGHHAVDDVPANARVAPFLPYDRLLAPAVGNGHQRRLRRRATGAVARGSAGRRRHHRGQAGGRRPGRPRGRRREPTDRHAQAGSHPGGRAAAAGDVRDQVQRAADGGAVPGPRRGGQLCGPD